METTAVGMPCFWRISPRLDREMQFRAGAQDGEAALAALGLQ
jgi:hypothetical protein